MTNVENKITRIFSDLAAASVIVVERLISSGRAVRSAWRSLTPVVDRIRGLQEVFNLYVECIHASWDGTLNIV